MSLIHTNLWLVSSLYMWGWKYTWQSQIPLTYTQNSPKSVRLLGRGGGGTQKHLIPIPNSPKQKLTFPWPSLAYHTYKKPPLPNILSKLQYNPHPFPLLVGPKNLDKIKQISSQTHYFFLLLYANVMKWEWFGVGIVWLPKGRPIAFETAGFEMQFGKPR